MTGRPPLQHSASAIAFVEASDHIAANVSHDAILQYSDARS